MTLTSTDELRSIAEYERRAQELLPRAMWDSIFGSHGAAGWETNTNNIDGLRRIKLNPRVLVDVASRSQATSALGCTISLPIIVGPSGHHQRVHSDGEPATARGAGDAGTVMVLSSRSSYSIDEIMAAAGGDLWFQLYVLRDRRINEALLRRAEESGFRALVLTVDTPGVSPRGGDARDASTDGPVDMHTLEPHRVNRIFRDVVIPGVQIPSEAEFMDNLANDLTWDDLAWFRSVTSMPIVVKGVQCAEDARLCREHGVSALVVSNHGGYALTDARPTSEVLPEVVAAAPGLEVYVDGGVRRGDDVLKLLALGARAILVGRAPLWGLTVGGAAGVRAVLDILGGELDVAMALCGVTDVTTVDNRLLAARSQAATT